MQFSEDHWEKIQDKFENFWLRFLGGVFEMFTPIGPMLTKMKKLQNPKHSCVKTIEKIIQEQFD